MKNKIIVAGVAALMLAGTGLPTLMAQDRVVATDNVKDPAAQAQAAIDRALDYLKSKQKPDGGWHGEKEPPGITAIVLRAYARAGRQDESVRKGFDKLLSHQLESGGIYRDMLANYNTAIAISALAASNNPAYRQRMDKAVAYLRSLQWTDKIEGLPNNAKVEDDKDPRFGGFGYGSKARPDGSNTQMALEALYEAGLDKNDPAFQNALKFITRMQNLSETNDQPWAGNDGGAIYTPANNGESFAGEYTDASGRRMLRSYGSMTYAMLKSFIYAGLTKDDPRVKAAWEWITRNWTLEENPGMQAAGPENARHGMYYYYMTLARALDVYDQPLITDPQGNKHDWRVELIAKLLSLQKDDGRWEGEQRWMEDNPVITTAYVVLALQDAVKDLKEHPVQRP